MARDSATHRPVNAAQREVLHWLAGGGSTNPPREEFKLSARALAGRGLATVTRRKGVWTASLTEAGRDFVDHDAYPPTAEPGPVRKAPNAPASRKARVTRRADVVARTGSPSMEVGSAIPPPRLLRAVKAPMSAKQYAVLRWVAAGCPLGEFAGTTHHVSLRALRERGLVELTGGRGKWAASITPDGTRRVEREARRIAEKRTRERVEAEQRDRRARADRETSENARQVLDLVLAGGRVDLALDYTEAELVQIEKATYGSAALPWGEKLTHEATRMDPELGFTVYLRPDFERRIMPRRVRPPGRMPKDPHPSVQRFRARRENVSTKLIPRAARFLQGIVDVAVSMGWTVSDKSPSTFSVSDRPLVPDLQIRTGSQTFTVLIGEVDARARKVRPFAPEWDLRGGSTGRVVANSSSRHPGGFARP